MDIQREASGGFKTKHGLGLSVVSIVDEDYQVCARSLARGPGADKKGE